MHPSLYRLFIYLTCFIYFYFILHLFICKHLEEKTALGNNTYLIKRMLYLLFLIIIHLFIYTWDYLF